MGSSTEWNRYKKGDWPLDHIKGELAFYAGRGFSSVSPAARCSLAHANACRIVRERLDLVTIVRALGPTLAQFGVPVLADPMLQLYDPNGTLIASNDAIGLSSFEIRASGFAPPDRASRPS